MLRKFVTAFALLAALALAACGPPRYPPDADGGMSAHHVSFEGI